MANKLECIWREAGSDGESRKNDASIDTTAGKRTCLGKAMNAVCGDRHLNYGSAEDNFARIAELWNAWWKIRQPGPFTSVDVAILMDLVKTARIANAASHADSWVDKAGYAACGFSVSGAGAAIKEGDT